jgi:hypothetical protein
MAVQLLPVLAGRQAAQHATRIIYLGHGPDGCLHAQTVRRDTKDAEGGGVIVVLAWLLHDGLIS